ncbi:MULTISPECIES: ISAzo13 family transposase [unclassified Streptomyces]|uniref:ISAzo13 family transposase n=1 Tax=Streptomyces sp. SID8354 TaxID=2690339 RepID=UPI000375DC11|nr:MULTISPECIES: ISAzo13 family transposase [unclassified Streptomyces]MYT29292.1 ISAzo13 family transposase [Streptomyces sp. SID8354]
MALPGDVHAQLDARLQGLLPHLNERQRRLILANEARILGHGGIRTVARIARVSESTVRKGVFELEAGGEPLAEGRVRKPGGGRQTAVERDPELLPALLRLVEPDERGDPMSPLRWTTKSLRNLAEELTRHGHAVSPVTVGRLLRENGFSLQAASKRLEGKQHPDRDVQFRYINEQVKAHQSDGEPVISVDTKKKEMLGQLLNPGRQWRPKGDPVEVEDHSFFFAPNGEVAIPYGIYDMTAGTGWVNVGVDHDTSVFAVESIRRWWHSRGSLDYPKAARLLITADAGGSNGYRYRVWKSELAALATETGLNITVCHFPPGTSKWNKVEHRLFSHITMNWRGRPLTSHEVVVRSIAATRTRTGLRVEAALDPRPYPLGVTVSKAQLQQLPIEYHPERGTWNYSIGPRGHSTCTSSVRAAPDTARQEALGILSDPRFTGMSHVELSALAERIAPDLGALREERLHRQRGRARRQEAGNHGRPALTPADKVLLAVVYLRHVTSQNVMAEMLSLNQHAIGPAIKDVRRALTEHGVVIAPTTLCFASSRDLIAFVRHGTLPPGRFSPSQALSDPVLTGMSRADLAALIERLSLRHAALVEKRRHQRRGGPRQPGTRGGVFRQKITDAERILAAVLYARKAGTRPALAEAFGIGLRTLNSALTEVQSILQEEGIELPPAATRFTTAADLLAAGRVLQEPLSNSDTPMS